MHRPHGIRAVPSLLKMNGYLPFLFATGEINPFSGVKHAIYRRHPPRLMPGPCELNLWLRLAPRVNILRDRLRPIFERRLIFAYS